MELIRPTLASQGGVVSRAQLRALELEAHDIRRLLRRHELSTIHPGVYVDHTGDPSWVSGPGPPSSSAGRRDWPPSRR